MQRLSKMINRCKIGGFVTLHHNEMRGRNVDLLSTVCKDVGKEPCLQQSENGVELRADVSARGFFATYTKSIC